MISKLICMILIILCLFTNFFIVTSVHENEKLLLFLTRLLESHSDVFNKYADLQETMFSKVLTELSKLKDAGDGRTQFVPTDGGAVWTPPPTDGDGT
jgi:hypothetical protein